MKKLFLRLALALLLCLFLPRLSRGVSPTGNDNATGVTGEYNGSITTAGSYDPYTGNAKRFIDDLTVTGSVGEYPLKWTRILNTRGGTGPFGNGGGWKHSYQWGLYIQQNLGLCGQTCVCDGPDGIVHYPDGRDMNLRWEENPPRYEQADGLEPMGDRVVGIGGGQYNLNLKDGGRVEFGPVPGVGLAVRAIVDPYGRRTTIERVSGLSWKITEPGGRFLQISYTTFQYPNTVNGGPPIIYVEFITKVEAFDGRGNLMEKVLYHYDGVPSGGWFPVTYFNLTRVDYDDEQAPHAAYVYNSPAPTNPGNPNWSIAPGTVKTCDDVRYAGAMSKIEYEYMPATGNPAPVAYGQIKAERNMTTHAEISKVDYPPGPTGFFQRIETRADGATRQFRYDGADGLGSYTDFAYLGLGEPYHWTTITFPAGPEAPTNPDHYFRVVKDARLHSTATEKERKIGAVMAVIHPNGSRAKYTYSDVNNPYYLASKTDENFNTTTYTRNPSTHQVERIDYPDGGFETFTYTGNPFGLVHEHTMTSGGMEVFEYDARGLKQTYTPPATPSDGTPGANPTRYFYYDAGNCNGRLDLIDRLRYVEDPLLHRTWYDYNQRGQVTRVTHHDTTYTQSHYNPDGTLDWTADENHPGAETDVSQRTRYENDEYKRVTKITNPLGKEIANSYAPWNGHGPLSHTTSSIYLTTLHSQKKIKRDYDSNCRLVETTQGWDTTDAAKTTSTYDEVGNLKTVKDPKGQSSGLVTAYVYNDRNRRESMTDPLNHTTSWLYDDAGNMKKETRADTKFRTWDMYDVMNRIKRTTGFLQEHTLYDYDPAGNLTSVTDANGGIYSTAYDELNRKKSATYPPDANTGQSQSEAWRYDIAGNLTWYRNPANQYKHFEYDPRNRQRLSYWNNSVNPDVTPTWNVGPKLATTPDAASRLTEIRTNDGETIVAFGYDDANHKLWEDQTLAGGWPTRRVETIPDDDGNRGTLSVAGVPDDYSFTYQYTQRQQLWRINRGGNPYFEYTYDENGNLTKRQHMTEGQGQDSTKFVYDEINRVTLCDQRAHEGPSYFARSNYNDYDLVNNLKSISREEDGNTGELFGYDDANQLSSVSYRVDVVPHAPGSIGGVGGDKEEVEKDAEREALAALEADPVREPLAEGAGIEVLVAGPRTVTYDNDAINRRSMTDNGTVTNYGRNYLNQYTAVTGHEQSPPVYDTNFNLSVYEGRHYTYDAERRLTSTTGNGNTLFVYDGLGRCVKRTIDGVTTVVTYDEWKPIVEWEWLNGASHLVAWNLYGPGADEVLVRNQPNTAGYLYYHLDAMGNVQFLLSDHPTSPGLEKYTYDAFGKPTITGWAGEPRPISSYGNRFLFTGREYLYTLGIYDYRHRHYHPGLGRFIQTDPLGLQIEGVKLSAEQTALYAAGSAPASFSSSELNLYRYCHNDPVDKNDPFGLLDTGDVKEFFYSVYYAGPRATFDAQPILGNTTGKFAVEQGQLATKNYGNNPNAGEAVRHEVWQAELARKYGEGAAKAIADAHEKYKSNDAQDSKRDQFNNKLGRENGTVGRSRSEDQQKARQESLERAKADVEAGRSARDKTDPRIEDPDKKLHK
jgi:RHS repeat-associated protein